MRRFAQSPTGQFLLRIEPTRMGCALPDGDPVANAKTFRGDATPLRVVFDKPAEPPAPNSSVALKNPEAYSGMNNSDQVPFEIKAFVRRKL